MRAFTRRCRVRGRVLILLLVSLVASLAAEGQESGKIARIGYLGSSPSDPFVDAFKQGLRELGYVEGRNIVVEYRWLEGRFERLPGLAADLVRLKVDVIVASSQGAVAAKHATSAIPIVMPIITDPVRLGLVASLAQPGGNATGFATQNDELLGKWMQLVKFKTGNLFTHAVAAGQVDLALNFIGPLVVSVEDYTSVVILAGVHAGCFELFGSERIRAIRDLKGKTVAIPGKGEPQHVFLASMLSYVGIDPRADIAWVTHPFAESARLLSEGKIDAYLGIAPEPQELRARKIGRLMVDSAVDRPWSQYFCCMAYANRDFVRRHPAATKRALRAILKAADLCAAAPAMAAQTVVTKGYTRDYGYAFELIKKLPYNMWRTQNHEDSLRFYALRLHEAGMIKLSPQKILSRSTDWRFLNELKKELKG